MLSGDWTSTSTTPGYWGTTYRYRRVQDGSITSGEVEFRPNLVQAGTYEVSVWYTQGANRATNAPFTVEYSGGSQTVAVNQQSNGSQWVVIGSFPFNAGTGGRVRLSNQATGTHSTPVVIADAVRFVKTGGSPITVQIGAPSRNAALVDPVAYTVTYSGATGISLGAGDITLNVTGDPSAVVSVSGTGPTTRKVTLSCFEGGGQLGISIAPGTATDGLGNSAPAAGPSQTFHVGDDPPSSGEFRGMWVSRFEWPSTNMATAKSNIDNFMTKLQANRFNAVLFQVRGQADTLYPSPDEPWSPLISPSGAHPGWDPLAYAVHAAHVRGLEFHAYINTHVAWQSGAHTGPASAAHLYWQHCNAADPARRDWLIHDAGGNPVQYASDDYVWLAPGVPEFQAYLRRQVMYVVQNYDVDGVHFDRIRMPGTAYSHDPISESRRNGEGNPAGLGFADWTRDQFTRHLRDLYAQIMEVKPHVKVSAAPLGLYRGASYTCFGGYPSTACGFLYSQSCTYQDAYAWLAAGAMDFMVPQIYWEDGGAKPDFREVLPEWIANGAGRHIYAGHNRSVGAGELISNINTTRNIGGEGNVVFSYSGFNSNNYWTAYSGPTGPYAQPATVPPMPWKLNPMTGIIIGTVKGTDGNMPVTDAHVTRSGLNDVALSSGDGLYSFLLVPPGTYTLEATKTGLGSRQVGGVTVVAGQATRVNISFAATDPPMITAQPEQQTVAPLAAASFTVQATGSGAVSYQWQKNGVDLTPDGRIQGTQSPILALEDTKVTDAAYYRCVISNEYGTGISDAAALLLNPGVSDFDADGDVDVEDFGRLQVCYSGTGTAQTDEICLAARLDGDSDVDQNDFGIFQACFSGPNVAASSSCTGQGP
ncbi:MAG: hypothetical protein AMXMBFR13_16840 [Phycisphaerae bacterium]